MFPISLLYLLSIGFVVLVVTIIVIIVMVRRKRIASRQNKGHENQEMVRLMLNFVVIDSYEYRSRLIEMCR